MSRNTDHRALRFHSLDDLDAELNRLERAHHATGVTASGNYSPGQNFHHLARWIRLDKTPEALPPAAWHMRVVGRFFKRRLLTKGFPKGLQGPDGKPQPEPDMTFDEGLADLRDALRLLREDDLTHRNPFLGPMTHEECVELHLRHAEHHLGFLHAGG